MSENKRFEELSKLNRNDLLDLQNKITSMWAKDAFSDFIIKTK